MRRPPAKALLLCVVLGCAAARPPRWSERFGAEWTASLQDFLNTRDPDGCRFMSRDRQTAFALRIDRRGQIVSVRVLESSGFDELDAVAMDALQRAGPLDRVPPPEAFAAANEIEVPYRLAMRAVNPRCRDRRQASLQRRGTSTHLQSFSPVKTATHTFIEGESRPGR